MAGKTEGQTVSLFDRIGNNARKTDAENCLAYTATLATDFPKVKIFARIKSATGKLSTATSEAPALPHSNKYSIPLAPLEIADDSAVNNGVSAHNPQDDRRYCTQCLNLRGRVCTVAAPGAQVSARQGYHPMRDVLHRCAGYWPDAGDHDQRRGVIRWPMI